ncbi:MAG: hypothetical protein AABW50_03125 [Nanoarchaeota archaeon]
MKRTILGIILFVSLIGLVSAQTWNCPMFGNSGTGTNVFGWIFNILILVALVLLIFLLVKQLNKKPIKK